MPSDRVLGKRKRKPVEKVEDDTDAAALEDAQAIFRRHFEAQFAPLEDETEVVSGKTGKSKSRKAVADEDIEDGNGDGIEDMRSDSESEDDGEWGGVSGEDSSDSAYQQLVFIQSLKLTYWDSQTTKATMMTMMTIPKKTQARRQKASRSSTTRNQHQLQRPHYKPP